MLCLSLCDSSFTSFDAVTLFIGCQEGYLAWKNFSTSNPQRFSESLFEDGHGLTWRNKPIKPKLKILVVVALVLVAAVVVVVVQTFH